MTPFRSIFQQPARKLLGAMILSLAVANITAAAKSTEQVEQGIGYKVYCMCGCVTALNHCPHENCPVKSEMHKIIRTDLAEGKTQPAIFQDLVARYGEQVLAAPPARGFNLTAWILPGVGLLFGLFLAITIVRRWHRPSPAPAIGGSAASLDPTLRAAVEDEMKKFVD